MPHPDTAPRAARPPARRAPWLLPALVALIALGGCATVGPRPGFDEVERAAAERAGLRVAWRQGTPEDAAADRAVAALLTDTLTAEAAVQVALLHDRRLQATYEELGVARAAVVQAGLLGNPVVGARASFPLEGGGPPGLGFSAAFHFLNAFFIPLRRSVAASAFEGARLRVTAAVLTAAAEARAAHARAVAAEQHAELMAQVVVATEASALFARRIHEAGNSPLLNALAEQALYEQARLDLDAAEAARTEAREALARRLGLWGAQTAFALPRRLPPAPDALPAPADVERRAVAASLDLGAARQDVLTAARRLGATDAEALVPELEVGGELEREAGHDGETEWHAGPEVEIALPLFDQGQARRAAGRAELRQAQARYHALGVDVRSAARTLRARLAAAHRAVRHYERVVLPLRARVTAETQLQVNAMQAGLFQLLQAKQMEIDAGRRYVDALAAFHQAQAALDLLLQGTTPALDGAALPGGAARSTPSAASDAH